jgi:hypothetical protein
MKVLLLSLMAVFAVSSVASATASAAVPQGPWWLKVENGKQVKIEQNKVLQLKSNNVGPFFINSFNRKIECKSVLSKGWLWNGMKQGQGKEILVFRGCLLSKAGCPVREVTLSQAKVRTELMWKYEASLKEHEELNTQEISDAYAPEEPPSMIEGVLRAKFLTITAPESGSCPAETIPLYAQGTEAKWEDQDHKKFNVLWGTGANVTPRNKDGFVVTLEWQLFNVRLLFQKGEEIFPLLRFSDEPAVRVEIDAGLKLEERFGLTEFGAWAHL